MIKLNNIHHIYDQDQVVKALSGINLTIRTNEFIGIVGHTGSGKSTFVQLLNGLIIPTEGQVLIDGININQEKKNLKTIRQRVGMVFQYPENQLFEETIYRDVAFGPRNLGLEEEEVEKRVKVALRLVGLDYDEFKDRSPFNLSGGQKRKVAIAGVLAMRPEVLVLDEPTAGLDPQGREQLLNLLQRLYNNYDMTIILISHRMEEIALLCTRVIVMDNGEVILDGTPREVFANRKQMQKIGLDLPEVATILTKLKEKGLKVRTDIFSIPEAAEEIIRELGRNNIC